MKKVILKKARNVKKHRTKQKKRKMAENRRGKKVQKIGGKGHSL